MGRGQIKWTEAATMRLIDKRIKHDSLFTGRRHSAHQGWELILNELVDEGMPRIHWKILKKKWNNLTQTYKNLSITLLHPPANSKSENSVVTWPFYNTLDQFLSSQNEMSLYSNRISFTVSPALSEHGNDCSTDQSCTSNDHSVVKNESCSLSSSIIENPDESNAIKNSPCSNGLDRLLDQESCQLSNGLRKRKSTDSYRPEDSKRPHYDEIFTQLFEYIKKRDSEMNSKLDKLTILVEQLVNKS